MREALARLDTVEQKTDALTRAFQLWSPGDTLANTTKVAVDMVIEESYATNIIKS